MLLALVPGFLQLRAIEPQSALPPPSEYEVKAAYLFHFASFVDWPERCFAGDNTRIVLGVLGKDPFQEILERTLAGKRALRREFVVKRAARMEDLGPTHILFISSSESARLPAILSQLEEACVLTVGESRDFTARGGMINFTVRDQRVRFEANLTIVKQTHLKISSQLLKLATIARES